MEHLEQEEMKISPVTVRRLRTERGWSQDQLAVVSGLSLRTIQRVEADGTASQETRTSLAATFGIQLSELAGDSMAAGQVAAGARPPSFASYKLGAGIAGAASLLAILGTAGFFPSWLAAVSSIAAIALIIYTGLGWYFTGSNTSQSRARRVAQTLFIFLAIFGAFASMHTGNESNIAIAAQIGLLSMLIYFILDFLLSRHRRPNTSR